MEEIMQQNNVESKRDKASRVPSCVVVQSSDALSHVPVGPKLHVPLESCAFLCRNRMGYTESHKESGTNINVLVEV